MKETCEYCEKEFLVASEANEPTHEGHKYNWRDPYACPYACPDECRRVSFTADPFQSEIRGDDTQHWLCSECVYDSYMEI